MSAHLYTQTADAKDCNTLISKWKLHPHISMQCSPFPLKKSVGNWWRYQFRSRWWRKPLLKASIHLEHGKSVIILYSLWRQVIFCQRHHVLTDLLGKQLLRAHYAIQDFEIDPIFPEKQTANTQIFQSSKILFSFWWHPSLSQPPTSPKAQSMLTNKVA